MSAIHTLGPLAVVTISGVNGVTAVRVAADEWRRLSPVGKVLAIHAAAGDATGGRPFSIIAEGCA